MYLTNQKMAAYYYKWVCANKLMDGDSGSQAAIKHFQHQSEPLDLKRWKVIHSGKPGSEN